MKKNLTSKLSKILLSVGFITAFAPLSAPLSNADEFMTYCERWGEYDPACPDPNAKKKKTKSTQHYIPSRNNANSHIVLCNDTRHMSVFI